MKQTLPDLKNYGEDERPAATGMGDIARMEPEKPKTFKQAFAAARAAGDKTFTFNGKKYTTAVAAPKPKALKLSDEELSTVRGGGRGKAEGDPTPGEGTVHQYNPAEIYRKQNVRPKAALDVSDERYVDKFAKGGSVGSASRRADGCAQRGKTKGRIV